MIRLMVLTLVLLVVTGCGDSKNTAQPTARTTTVTEQDAISTATQAVSENDGWSNAQLKAEPMGNGWQVTAEGPNGEIRLIMIDGNGAVAKYQG